MKLIRVALTLKNKNYARDLAKRLLEISDGLEIEIFSYNSYISKEKFDIIITDDNIDIFKPVRALFNDIVTNYQEKYGKFFITSGDKKLRICSFRSETGGAGTTSIAISFAKSIALLSTMNKVLYISTSRKNNLNQYMNAQQNYIRRSEELYYLIRKGKSANLDNYILHDLDGVDYLQINNSIYPLLEAIPDISEYSHVIIDLGTNEKLEIDCESYFIRNEMDKRSIAFSNEDEEKIIINNCEKMTNSFMIPFSPESFEFKNGYVDILKEGTFYRTVRAIARDYK